MFWKNSIERLKIAKMVISRGNLKQLPHLVHWFGRGIEIAHAIYLSVVCELKLRESFGVGKAFSQSTVKPIQHRAL
jgi:hypothetical protein